MAKNYNKENKKIIRLEGKIKELEESFDQLNTRYEILEELKHETGRLSSELLSQAEALKISLDGPSSASHKHSHNRDLATKIAHTASMMNSRMLYSNIMLNLDLLEQTPKFPAGIYKKFDKAKRILESFLKDKKIQLDFKGQSTYTKDMISAFDCVPFIILDNAIKYSPQNGAIEVIFEEDLLHTPRLLVQVLSMGPSINKSDLLRLKERGYKVRKESEGYGLGLYIADNLCKLYDIELSFKSDDINKIPIDGIKYSQFTAILKFK